MNCVEFWDDKPEKNWEASCLDFWDRRIGIRIVAELLKRPRFLEVGVDNADVLLHCHDVLSNYIGVDIQLKERPKSLKHLTCPFRFVESSSSDFWKSLKDTDLFDLIYIDGDHSDIASHLDITQAMFRLAPGGYILAHDCATGDRADTGPNWSFNRVCNFPGWYGRILDRHGEGMAIFFRKDE